LHTRLRPRRSGCQIAGGGPAGLDRERGPDEMTAEVDAAQGRGPRPVAKGRSIPGDAVIGGQGR
jgi:hypothetical protein